MLDHISKVAVNNWLHDVDNIIPVFKKQIEGKTGEQIAESEFDNLSKQLYQIAFMARGQVMMLEKIVEGKHTIKNEKAFLWNLSSSLNNLLETLEKENTRYITINPDYSSYVNRLKKRSTELNLENKAPASLGFVSELGLFAEKTTSSTTINEEGNELSSLNNKK